MSDILIPVVLNAMTHFVRSGEPVTLCGKQADAKKKGGNEAQHEFCAECWNKVQGISKKQNVTRLT